MDFQNIPFSSFVLICFVGLLLYLCFRLYQRFLLPIFSSQKQVNSHLRKFKRIEIVIWIAYCIIVIVYFLETNLIISGILIGLVLLAFYNFWRNYFAGIVLSFSDSIHIGDLVSLNGLNGRVIHFGYQSLRIQTSEGEEILLPYSQISSEIKIKKNDEQRTLFKSIEIDKQFIQSDQITQSMRNLIYLNPWILLNSPIDISIEKQSVTISFNVLSNDHYEKAKQRFMNDLNNE